MRADEIGRVVQPRAGLAFVFEQGEVDDAIGKINSRAHLEVLLADALQLEHLFVEGRGLLEVLNYHRYVPQLRHAHSIKPPIALSADSALARGS